MDISIRNEEPRDFGAVEELTRKAFWNVYRPGGDEHFLVHTMRDHADFVPELDLVMERDGKIVGNIMYTRSMLLAPDGSTKESLTFGPISIDPAHQRQGLGKRLLLHSLAKAREIGCGAVVIFGDPNNYVGIGFRSARRYGISAMDGKFPSAMLAMELTAGYLTPGTWRYRESQVYILDGKEAEIFDGTFGGLEKAIVPSQEVFYILSHSSISE